jgi:hypothetical protein
VPRLSLVIGGKIRKVLYLGVDVLSRLTIGVLVVVFTDQKIQSLSVFSVLYQIPQVLDRLSYLMGVHNPDFTTDEISRVPIRDEPNSEEENKHGSKAHSHLSLK